MPRSKRKKPQPAKTRAPRRGKKKKARSGTATATAIAAPTDDVTMAVAPSADDVAATKKAAQKMKNKAAKAARDAQAEPANKAKALAFEHAERVALAPTAKTDIVHPLRKKHSVVEAADPGVTVGSYVEVLDDLRPGRCVYHGWGWVERVNGLGPLGWFFGDQATTIDVRLINGGSVKGIPLDRYNVITYDHEALPRDARALKGRRAASSKPPPPAPEQLAVSFRLPMQAALKHAHSTNLGQGWRRRQLGHHTGKIPRLWKPTEKTRFLTEHRAMLAFTGGGVMHARRNKRSGKLKKRSTKRPPPFSCAYLAWSWGAGPNTAKGFIKEEVRLCSFYFFDVI